MQVLDVTGFLKYAVQAAAMFETRFNSVERLMAYFELPQEAPRLIEATKCAATAHSIISVALLLMVQHLPKVPRHCQQCVLHLCEYGSM